jgi:hypothetical protein
VWSSVDVRARQWNAARHHDGDRGGCRSPSCNVGWCTCRVYTALRRCMAAIAGTTTCNTRRHMPAIR